MDVTVEAAWSWCSSMPCGQRCFFLHRYPPRTPPAPPAIDLGASSLLACSLGLSATSQQYFSLRTNQPPATSQQYFSLRTNQR
jgi:hypothetical protein